VEKENMDVINAVQLIRNKFAEIGNPAKIPYIRGSGTFTASLKDEGVEVTNLRNQPFLQWAAFQEAVYILIKNGGRALRGDAMQHKLGQSKLPLNSVEGHIAQVVYGYRAGDIVFRRITPISCILIWAGICEHAPSELILRDLP
jgi:hypothetical protein